MGNSSLNTTEASADLAALLGRATPGKWESITPADNLWPPRLFSGSTYLAIIVNSDMTQDQRIANAALIALAPTLAAEVLRLRAEIREAALRYLSAHDQMWDQIAALLAANAALAADNARLGKRVKDARNLIELYRGMINHPEANRDARAWLAGGDA